MKKLVLFALTSFLSLAYADNAMIMVVPNPGVTVNQLSQDEINAIAAEAGNVYAQGEAAAVAKYQDAIAALGKLPKVNKSSKIYNDAMLKATKERDSAIDEAKKAAACRAEELCNNVCSVQVEGKANPYECPKID